MEPIGFVVCYLPIKIEEVLVWKIFAKYYIEPGQQQYTTFKKSSNFKNTPTERQKRVKNYLADFK